jgi:hypothetical protein
MFRPAAAISSSVARMNGFSSVMNSRIAAIGGV